MLNIKKKKNKQSFYIDINLIKYYNKDKGLNNRFYLNS